MGSYQPQMLTSMNAIKSLGHLAALAVAMVSPLEAQQPAAPDYYQVLHYIKVPAPNRTEFNQLIKEVSIKTAETRVNSGEIISWTLLQSVMPAGSEARSDYLMSTMYAKLPPAPLDHSGNSALFKKAAIAMSYDEYLAKRDKVSSLVAMEMWKPMRYVGAPQKGHYLFINQMKVKNERDYVAFEETVWRPIAEHLVKEGKLSGWLFATKVLPEGAETLYSAYTADMFPTWEAVFSDRAVNEAFAKVHPGKNIDETFVGVNELRSLAVRQLWVVRERVAK